MVWLCFVIAGPRRGENGGGACFCLVSGVVDSLHRPVTQAKAFGLKGFCFCGFLRGLVCLSTKLKDAFACNGLLLMLKSTALKA